MKNNLDIIVDYLTEDYLDVAEWLSEFVFELLAGPMINSVKQPKR